MEGGLEEAEPKSPNTGEQFDHEQAGEDEADNAEPKSDG